MADISGGVLLPSSLELVQPLSLRSLEVRGSPQSTVEVAIQKQIFNHLFESVFGTLPFNSCLTKKFSVLHFIWCCSLRSGSSPISCLIRGPGFYLFSHLVNGLRHCLSWILTLSSEGLPFRQSQAWVSDWRKTWNSQIEDDIGGFCRRKGETGRKVWFLTVPTIMQHSKIEFKPAPLLQLRAIFDAQSITFF